MKIDYSKLSSDLKEFLDKRSTDSYNRNVARRHGGQEVVSLPAGHVQIQAAYEAVLWFEKHRKEYVGVS